MKNLEKRVKELEYKQLNNDSTLQIRLPKQLHKDFINAYPERGEVSELLREYIISLILKKM